MKLAEALISRSDLQKRVEQLRNRIQNNVMVQEGDSPTENPEELIKELSVVIIELTSIIRRINLTNSSTPFDENLTIADALAERDGIWLKRSVLSSVVDSGTIRRDRYSNTEVRYVTTVDLNMLQKEVDRLSMKFREIDTKIQALNWNVDLM